MKRNISGRTAVAPVPVLIVGSYDANGIPNAMNVAWGGQCGYNEIALNLSTNHKTTENIRLTKAFTVSIGTVDTMLISDYVGLVSGHKENKLEKLGLTYSKSSFVNAPIIDIFPLTLECEVLTINNELGETRIVGRVVNMQADESILNESGNIDYGKLRPIYYDSEPRCYREIAGIIGKAFHDGLDLLK